MAHVHPRWAQCTKLRDLQCLLLTQCGFSWTLQAAPPDESMHAWMHAFVEPDDDLLLLLWPGTVSPRWPARRQCVPSPRCMSFSEVEACVLSSTARR